MMLVNIETLIKLTGSTRRTINKKTCDLQRTSKGREIFLESKDALPIILDIRQFDSKTLEGERTRLASVQAEKAELEVDVMKGKLIPSTAVESVVNAMVMSFKLKMLSLPTKAAPAVVVMADPLAAETLLREYVYEALQELSNYDPGQYSTISNLESGEAGSATTSTDGESMGGQQKKVKSGVKRRTGSVEH